MYESFTYAEKVVKGISKDGQNISDFVILRYEARATEAIACKEDVSVE